jgi:prevent-host-death family protein
MMKHFSATDLGEKTGDVLAAAAQAPIMIERHGKPRFVILSHEEYERRVVRKDPRRAFNLADLNDAEAAALIQALENSIKND